MEKQNLAHGVRLAGLTLQGVLLVLVVRVSLGNFTGALHEVAHVPALVRKSMR